MMDQGCCGDCENCREHHSKHDVKMTCCMDHAMSKEHLEMKKRMLEEKLKWVKTELGKK